MPRSDNTGRSVRLLDLTLSSPAENLALDEALLDHLDDHGGAPVLRFWESDRPFIVLGLAGNVADDVHEDLCRQDGVPILRRASGGGTVLQGPGCLSYALVLPLAWHPDLAGIRSTHRFVLERIARALQSWAPAIALRGISDLAVDGLKISGNAQRRQRNALLFHGTILYGLPAELIARYLKNPKRRPDYRDDREHESFVTTIDAKPHDLKQAIARAWDAHMFLGTWPWHRMPAILEKVAHRALG
jgi:lipoate-protein ligase A